MPSPTSLMRHIAEFLSLFVASLRHHQGAGAVVLASDKGTEDEVSFMLDSEDDIAAMKEYLAKVKPPLFSCGSCRLYGTSSQTCTRGLFKQQRLLLLLGIAAFSPACCSSCPCCRCLDCSRRSTPSLTTRATGPEHLPTSLSRPSRRSVPLCLQ